MPPMRLRVVLVFWGVIFGFGSFLILWFSLLFFFFSFFPFFSFLFEQDGETPLHRACIGGHSLVVSFLLSANDTTKADKKPFLDINRRDQVIFLFSDKYSFMPRTHVFLSLLPHPLLLFAFFWLTVFFFEERGNTIMQLK